jgi:hypothetical protein
MQIDFLVEVEWSEALVRKVHRAYRRSGNNDGHVFFGGLNWRIVDHREVRGQIFGVRIKTIPRVLRQQDYNYEIFLYDFLVNPRLKTGRYTHAAAGSAVGALTPVRGPDDKPMFKLKIQGKTLAEVNALYELITQLAIKPEGR